MDNFDQLQKICRLIRYDIIKATSAAGSGHPSSSLSAVELITTLFFGGFLKYDLKNPNNQFNDRVIFSKGHAAPLLYSLYHTAGVISLDELLTLRTFNSNLEGHPTPRFPFVDVATGSLGQGLSIGVGMALGMKLNKLAGGGRGRVPDSAQRFFQPVAGREHWREGIFRQDPRIWVLLGDSEMSEGQVWEAMQIASYYKLNNLIAILDVNRLGQRGETMLGWDLETYAKRAEAFGWNPVIVDDGHDLKKIINAYKEMTGVAEEGFPTPLRPSDFEGQAAQAGLPTEASAKVGRNPKQAPSFIIAKTIKGKGVSFLENQDGWHGKTLNKEQTEQAIKELGEVDLNIKGKITFPNHQSLITNNQTIPNNQIQNKKDLSSKIYDLGSSYSTREAYGDALIYLGQANENIVVLDAEVSNSTYAEKFAKKFPDRFFEMFIAEQNMVSTALGLSKQGFIPFISSFAAFLTRGFDQLRMAQYSGPNLKICGSHSGVSIGADGPSQMGLEDIAIFRTISNSVIFYPSDAVSAYKLTQIMAENPGLFYLRTTRGKTPVIYQRDEEFKIGGSKILKQPENSKALVIAAGITVHEALKAYEQLTKEGIGITVVDLYSVKPIDQSTIQQLAINNKNIIVVEDHYPAGGIGEAVLSAISNNLTIKQFNNFIHLSVTKTPRSGRPDELMAYEEIDSDTIIKSVKPFL